MSPPLIEWISGNRKSASGIFRTNNFALGPLESIPDHGVGGKTICRMSSVRLTQVFSVSSRLNHSCSPNCEVQWSSEEGIQVMIWTERSSETWAVIAEADSHQWHPARGGAHHLLPRPRRQNEGARHQEETTQAIRVRTYITTCNTALSSTTYFKKFFIW